MSTNTDTDETVQVEMSMPIGMHFAMFGISIIAIALSIAFVIGFLWFGLQMTRSVGNFMRDLERGGLAFVLFIGAFPLFGAYLLINKITKKYD